MNPANERIAVALPRRPGILGPDDDDYERHSSTSLFAAGKRQRQDSRPRLPPVEDVVSTDFLQSLDRPLSFPKTLERFVLAARSLSE